MYRCFVFLQKFCSFLMNRGNFDPPNNIEEKTTTNLLRIFFQGCFFFFSNHTNLEFGGASFLSEMMMTMGRNFMQRREIFQVMNGMCVTIKWLESVFFVFFFHCGTLGWVYVVFLNSFSWYFIFITFSFKTNGLYHYFIKLKKIPVIIKHVIIYWNYISIIH